MAFRTTIRNAGDLRTEHIAGADSEFVIEATKFASFAQQTCSNFTELRGLSTKSQIINVIGTGSFERQTYVAQVDDNLNTIVTSDRTYAYVRHPGTINVRFSDNTTAAGTQSHEPVADVDTIAILREQLAAATAAKLSRVKCHTTAGCGGLT